MEMELIDIYQPARFLRSSCSLQLKTAPYKLKNYGYRSFSVQAPILWNSLPPNVRFSDSLNVFKSRLKTHLFIDYFDPN